ncbi:unnamed protein product, partial [Coccothraustes coccothraustes]
MERALGLPRRRGPLPQEPRRLGQAHGVSLPLAPGARPFPPPRPPALAARLLRGVGARGGCCSPESAATHWRCRRAPSASSTARAPAAARWPRAAAASRIIQIRTVRLDGKTGAMMDLLAGHGCVKS